MMLTFLTLGMMAARLGTFITIVDPFWGALVGVIIAGIGFTLFFGEEGLAATLPLRLQHRLRGTGWAGSFGLGALVGTVMSPCATPALAAALAIAGAGTVKDGSVWLGGGLLLAYGIGHSILLLLAGIAPVQAWQLISRLDGVRRWLPGRRFFALITALAGGWLAISNIMS